MFLYTSYIHWFIVIVGIFLMYKSTKVEDQLTGAIRIILLGGLTVLATLLFA